MARSEHERASAVRLQVEGELLRKSDRIIASTQAELAQFQWLYQADTSRVVAIPPGVDTSRFYPIPSDEAKEFIGQDCNNSIILFVGRIEPLKGIDTLIESMAILMQQGTLDRHNLCVAIIGGDPEANPDQMTAEMGRLQALRMSLGLGDMVAFLGRARSRHAAVLLLRRRCGSRAIPL